MPSGPLLYLAELSSTRRMRAQRLNGFGGAAYSEAPQRYLKVIALTRADGKPLNQNALEYFVRARSSARSKPYSPDPEKVGATEKVPVEAHNL